MSARCPLPQGLFTSFKGRIRPGDVYLLNDPYRGGNHLPDLTVFVPVFDSGRLMFWSINRSHQSGIGGATHGAYNAIESSRNRGARVRMLDARELAEITDVRAELEGYAAGLASDRLKGDTAELEKNVSMMRQSAKAKDMRRFAEANTRFHRSIVEATGNGTLLDIWMQLDVKAHTIMNVLRGHRNLASVAESHWPIVAALKVGDARAVRRAIRKHILDLKLVVP